MQIADDGYIWGMVFEAGNFGSGRSVPVQSPSTELALLEFTDIDACNSWDWKMLLRYQNSQTPAAIIEMGNLSTKKIRVPSNLSCWLVGPAKKWMATTGKATSAARVFKECPCLGPLEREVFPWGWVKQPLHPQVIRLCHSQFPSAQVPFEKPPRDGHLPEIQQSSQR